MYDQVMYCKYISQSLFSCKRIFTQRDLKLSQETAQESIYFFSAASLFPCSCLFHKPLIRFHLKSVGMVRKVLLRGFGRDFSDRLKI